MWKRLRAGFKLLKVFAREAFSDIDVQGQPTVILPRNALLSYKNQLEI